MAKFVVQQLPYALSPNAGLAMFGQYLRRVEPGRLFEKPSYQRVIEVRN
ncbi:MAG TPA: hypothetical protein VFQ88_06940 [Nevskiaceae bacterium]|nr:hypothetical protein [Nevskiaceae bacterium]